MNATIRKIGLLFSLIMVAGIFGTVSAQGIEFHHGTFAEAKAKAAKENKIIFVDAYAKWCGPCKWMAANTFTDTEVGEYFNDNFIPVKMDMEVGEGRTLARQWGIRAYPTLLFFDAEGKEVHRDLGAKKKEQLLQLGKTVVEKKS